jgi:hypothetical protein
MTRWPLRPPVRPAQFDDFIEYRVTSKSSRVRAVPSAGCQWLGFRQMLHRLLQNPHTPFDLYQSHAITCQNLSQRWDETTKESHLRIRAELANQTCKANSTAGRTSGLTVAPDREPSRNVCQWALVLDLRASPRVRGRCERRTALRPALRLRFLASLR